jgi:hypothetical protein
MDTFTNIYYNAIVQSLMLYENDKRYINDDTISYKLELEFDEERGIEIELYFNKDYVIDMLNIFYLIVCDARYAYCYKDSENYDDFQDYIECILAEKKLCFLVGDENYKNLMTCEMDYKEV